MKQTTLKYKSLVKSLAIINSCLLVTTLVISGCSKESVRPDSSGQAPSSSATQGKPASASKADRDKYRKALTELNNGNGAKAERAFAELMRNNPALAGPYSNMALIYYKKKDFEKSIKLAEKAIKLNPKQAQAYHLRGQNYIAMGKVHEAKADYIKAIELKPNYANAQYNLALLYDVYLQEIALAIKHYKIYMSLLKKPDEATKDWIAHLKGTLRDE